MANKSIPPPARVLLTVSEAAERIGVSHMTIRRLIKSGDLRAYRMGPRMVRVDLADVDAYVFSTTVIPVVSR